MTLQPLIDTTFAIQLHVMTAILAFFLGGMILFRRKGDRLHRIGGVIWVGLMLVVALSSFFIHVSRMVGIWSPIHLLSIATIIFLVRGVWYARQRNIAAHRGVMQGLYLGALVLAGFFTFMPGRIMYRVFFEGPSPAVGVAVALTVVIGGAVLAWRGMKAPQRPVRAAG